jgi:hypothetical protein
VASEYVFIAMCVVLMVLDPTGGYNIFLGQILLETLNQGMVM